MLCFCSQELLAPVRRSKLYITSMSVKNLTENQNWRILECQGDVPERWRFGHTVTKIKNTVYFFGGVNIGWTGIARKIFNQLFSFDVITKTWQKIKLQMDETELLDQMNNPVRHFHSASSHGNCLLIYGGISQKQVFINHLTRINLSNLQLSKIKVEDQVKGIAYHKTWCYFSTKQKKKKEFLLCFGGKDQNGAAVARMRYLDLNQCIQFGWRYAITKGMQPLPRFKHTMEYFKKLHMLFIYGGINQKGRVFNDCFFYCVETFVWQQLRLQGSMFYKYSHNSAATAQGIIIFGGLNQQYLWNNSSLLIWKEQ